MSINDQNIALAKLQSDIASYLGVKQDKLIFSFKQRESIVKLDLITINPNHDQSFLFHSIKAVDKIEALEKMLEYIQLHYKNEDSYTLQWVKVGEDHLNTSYFRAKNIYEALDKFFYERDLNSYKLYSVSLNPMS